MVHQLCPCLLWHTPTMHLTSCSAVCNSQAGTHCTWCIFYSDISPSHLALSHALGPNALCCAMAALSAPLADMMLAVPSARAGAANDPHHLYMSMPKGQLPSCLCIFTALLSLFVYMPLIYACQGLINSPHICINIHSCTPFVYASQHLRGRPPLCSCQHSQPPAPPLVYACQCTRGHPCSCQHLQLASLSFACQCLVYYHIGIHSPTPLSSFRSRFTQAVEPGPPG
jgi:hypothetical protein